MAAQDYTPESFYDEVKQFLRYEPETGNLYWTKNIGRNSALELCSQKPCGQGYKRIRYKSKTIPQHRIAFYMYYGYLPNIIDHIDGVRTNNKIENLREATNAQNIMNSRIPKNNKSGYKGVCWKKDRKKWYATIIKDNKQFYLGSFLDIKAAVNKVQEARIALHGEFANHG